MQHEEIDDALLQRVKSRVLRALGESGAAPHLTIRSTEGTWEELAPGVQRKWLWTEGSARSCLLRLAPGAQVAPHAHPLTEECVVLEGSVRIGDDLVLRAGDFHLGREGRDHLPSVTETGALLYLRGAFET